MSYCNNVCRICDNLVISESVLFDPTSNSLDITIPNNGYRNCDVVCIVVAQTIPASTTINALVNIVVGGTRFPLIKTNCTQATACEIQTRTKYKTRVLTNTVSGTFRLQGKICCARPSNLVELPIDTTTLAQINTLSTTRSVASVSSTSKTKKEALTNE